MLPHLQIRVFPNLEKTLKYAKMLERAGAWMVAVHGRTREQKDAKQVKADWNAIRVRPSVCLLLYITGIPHGGEAQTTAIGSTQLGKA